eukprot:10735129-Alexandrium_andersonii.AAC.1
MVRVQRVYVQFQEGFILLREPLLELLRGGYRHPDHPAGASGASGLSGCLRPPRTTPKRASGTPEALFGG